MHRQRTVPIDVTVATAAPTRKSGRVAQCLIDLTGCDSAAGVTMFVVDVLFLIVVCAIQGFVVARDNQMLQIDRGAKIKCDGAFQNVVRMKERTKLLTQSQVAFYAASDFFATRSQFRTFANGRHFNDSVLQAIEWIPEVLHESNRTTLEAEGAAYGSRPSVQARYPGWSYTFHQSVAGVRHSATPANSGPYYPVHYIEPLEGNEAALGFNLASSAARLAAINQAKATGQPVASSRISLVQSVTPQFGYLYFEPMASTNAFEGLILAVFKCDEMLAEAVAGYDLRGVYTLLFDVSDGAESYLAHFIEGEPASARFEQFQDASVAAALQSTGADLHWTYEMDNGGRSWRMLCGIGREYYGREQTNIELFTFFTLFGMDYSTTILLMIFALFVKWNADKAVVKMRAAAARVRTGKRLAQVLEFTDAREELQALYVTLDANGDGKLSAEEWSHGLATSERGKALFVKYFGDTAKEDHIDVFKMLDADGNGDLSWEEFAAGAKQFGSS